MTDEEPSKTCAKCKVLKSVAEFSKCSSKKDGLQGKCKVCQKEYRQINKEHLSELQKAYYEDHREELSARSKQFYAEHKDKCAEQKKRYYQKHRKATLLYAENYRESHSEDISRKGKLYYIEHKEEIIISTGEYRRTNPEKMKAHGAKYRGTKLNAIPSWFEKEAIDAVYSESISRSKSEGVDYHVDHIVPLQSKFVCGLHCLANLQLLTKSENSRKSNRHWPGQKWIIHP
jgi:hypothetical protein